jgi:hypothetical protein
MNKAMFLGVVARHIQSQLWHFRCSLRNFVWTFKCGGSSDRSESTRSAYVDSLLYPAACQRQPTLPLFLSIIIRILGPCAIHVPIRPLPSYLCCCVHVLFHSCGGLLMKPTAAEPLRPPRTAFIMTLFDKSCPRHIGEPNYQNQVSHGSLYALIIISTKHVSDTNGEYMIWTQKWNCNTGFNDCRSCPRLTRDLSVTES